MREDNPVVKSVSTAIEKARAKLSTAEIAILALLIKNWGDGMRISQREIARTEAWIGVHPKHEAAMAEDYYETTTRMVRQVIRDLRVTHKIPVLADSDGYFLPNSQEEVDRYLTRMEQEARARAAASIITYNAMRDALGVHSAFFEQLNFTEQLKPVAEEDESDEAAPAPEPGAVIKTTSVNPPDYIWSVLKPFISAKFPRFKDHMHWEQCAPNSIRWRIVFFVPPEKKERSELVYAITSIGISSPTFEYDSRGAVPCWHFSMVCTKHSMRAAFGFRKRMAAFEEDQQALFKRIKAVATENAIDVSHCIWRPSNSQPFNNYVLEFPKGGHSERGQLIKHLEKSGLTTIAEAGVDYKIIFAVRKK